MRRYATVQRARDADVIGILVGTLGVGASFLPMFSFPTYLLTRLFRTANYLPLIAHLRALIARAHKKSYTISVGKVNPAKLGNFLEVEAFVLVACPENSMLDAKEFLRPIVTPYELEVALRPKQEWTGRYVLDFGQLLSSERGEQESGDEGEQRLEMAIEQSDKQ